MRCRRESVSERENKTKSLIGPHKNNMKAKGGMVLSYELNDEGLLT